MNFLLPLSFLPSFLSNRIKTFSALAIFIETSICPPPHSIWKIYKGNKDSCQ